MHIHTYLNNRKLYKQVYPDVLWRKALEKTDAPDSSSIKSIRRIMDSLPGWEQYFTTREGKSARAYRRVSESSFRISPLVTKTDTIRGNTPNAKPQVVSQSVERQNILQEANSIVRGDRQADYGDTVANFKHIANIASAIRKKEFTAEDCCVVLMAVKLAREQFKHKRDNLVDLAGYTEILNQIKEVEK